MCDSCHYVYFLRGTPRPSCHIARSKDKMKINPHFSWFILFSIEDEIAQNPLVSCWGISTSRSSSTFLDKEVQEVLGFKAGRFIINWRHYADVDYIGMWCANLWIVVDACRVWPIKRLLKSLTICCWMIRKFTRDHSFASERGRPQDWVEADSSDIGYTNWMRWLIMWIKNAPNPERHPICSPWAEFQLHSCAHHTGDTMYYTVLQMCFATTIIWILSRRLTLTALPTVPRVIVASEHP